MIDFATAGLPPTLGAGELHLWVIPLTDTRSTRRAVTGLLSADELERASRFRHDLHRHRFVARRTALRELLGRYLGEEPGRLRFAYGPYGKPSVVSASGAGGQGGAGLTFSLSHREDHAVCVIGREALLGVDIEVVRAFPEMEPIAERFFSPPESAAIAEASAAERPAAFYRFWTCKEALLKAIGAGFGRPLDSFVVEIETDSQPRLLHADGDDPAAWTLFSFSFPPTYAGSIAVRGDPRIVRACYYPRGQEGC
jgi:4'-phosphopantetheinyl transferase